jgi:hypothetical protein
VAPELAARSRLRESSLLGSSCQSFLMQLVSLLERRASLLA